MDKATAKALVLYTEEQFSQSLLESLNDLGIEVTRTMTLQETEKAIGQDLFQLVYLDFELLGETAPQFLTQLKERVPEAEIMVFCDPLTPIRQVIQAMKIWCGDFMIKPVDIETVVDKTKAFVRQGQNDSPSYASSIKE